VYRFDPEEQNPAVGWTPEYEPTVDTHQAKLVGVRPIKGEP